MMRSLLRHLALADGFMLGLVYVADDQRPEWDAEARALGPRLERLRGERVQVEHLRAERLARDPCVGADTDALVDGLLGACASIAGPFGVVVLDGTRTTGPEDDAWRDLFAHLNERRNSLRDVMRGAVVIATHARLEGAFARIAPDLWSVRAATCRLGAAPEDSTLDVSDEPTFRPADDLRIAECAAAEPDPLRRPRWRVRRALCAIATGRREAARELLRGLHTEGPELDAWRALLQGDLDDSPELQRAERWLGAASTQDAPWPVLLALRLRASDALRGRDPARAVAILDDAEALIPRDAEEGARLQADFELSTRRVDLLATSDPARAAALASSLVEALRSLQRRVRFGPSLPLLSRALLRLGDARRREGRLGDARAAWREALELVETLRARDPHRGAWAEGEALLVARLAETERVAPSTPQPEGVVALRRSAGGRRR